MRNLFLILVLFFTLNAFSQSACSCDSLLGDCIIQCSAGETASCGETWYGGCECKCKEKVISDKPVIQEYGYEIDINKVEKMHKFFKKIDHNKLSEFENLVLELKKHSKNSTYITKDEDKYGDYFLELSKYFNTLNYDQKKQLHDIIEMS